MSKFLQVKSTLLNKAKGATNQTDDENSSSDADADAEQLIEGEVSLKEFNYLVNMPFISLTEERVNKLTKEVEAKQLEIELLQGKTKIDLWEADLDNFLVVLD